MRLPKFRFAVFVGAFLGVVAPALFFTSHFFQEFIGGASGAFLWPSGIWLLATEGHEHELSAYAIIGISIAANILCMPSCLACSGVLVGFCALGAHH